VNRPPLHLDSRAVHLGTPRAHAHQSIAPAVCYAATFPFATFAEARAVVERRGDQDDYARYTHPTVRELEQALASLEGAGDAVVFSTGMAAMTALLLTLTQQGRHVVLGTECYRPTEQLVEGLLGRFGVTCTRVPAGDPETFAAAIRPGETSLVLLESPTNPHLRLPDVAAIDRARRAHRGVRLVVDATLLGPATHSPLQQGADLVLHSVTKSLAGHNDVLAGAIVGRAGLCELLRDLRGQTGATLDAHAAWTVLRGLKTYPVRWQRQSETALALARRLEADPRIARVWYPGLPSHPEHAQAMALQGPLGGLLSFEHRGDLDATERFCDALHLVRLAASLGGTESLLHPPALFSYWDMAPADRLARGIPDSLLRLSVGLEHPDDLWNDLRGALDAALGEG
jgi:cystathionine gamma-synthase